MNVFSITQQEYHQCDFCDQLAKFALEFECTLRDEVAIDYLCADCGTEVIKCEYPFPSQHCQLIVALRVIKTVEPHYWVRIVYPTDTTAWGYAIEDATLWYDRCYDVVATSEPKFASHAAAMEAGRQHIASLYEQS